MTLIKTADEFEQIEKALYGVAINIALTVAWLFSAFVIVKFHIHFYIGR